MKLIWQNQFGPSIGYISPVFEISMPPMDIYMEEEADVVVNGQCYRIYVTTDEDYFPSNPHAHWVEKGLKLHLGNGWLFRKRKCLGRIKKNTFFAIRKGYEERGINLPPLEWGKS